jgi:hypothetical protein
LPKKADGCRKEQFWRNDIIVGNRTLRQMKTIHDKVTREELIERITRLQQGTPPQWGKMNLYQMLKHCRLWEEMGLGDTVYKRVFMGRLFGRMALKRVLKGDAPLGRNSPTIPEFIITDTGDIAAEKAKWIALIERYGRARNGINHPFFGTVTPEQLGQMAYKHADHHLSQFNS